MIPMTHTDIVPETTRASWKGMFHATEALRDVGWNGITDGGSMTRKPSGR